MKEHDLLKGKVPLIAIAAAILAGLTFGYWLLTKQQQKAQPEGGMTQAETIKLLYEIDFGNAEPQVVEKILRLRKKVENNPESGVAWGHLAVNLDVHDYKQEAILCYKQASSLDLLEFRWPYYCAIAFRDTGSPQAGDWFQKAIVLSPDYMPMRIRYGQYLMDSGKIDEASAEFQKAIAAGSRSSHAYLGLARIALRNGKLEESLDLLRKAVEFNHKHGEAHGLIAEVYRRLGQTEESNREMLMAQELPGTTPLDDPVIGEWVSEGISAYWYHLRGKALLESGQNEDAIRQLETAIRMRPAALYHDTLGILYLRVGKIQESIEQHRAALKIDPNSAPYMSNLASALFAAGRVQDAIDAAEKAKVLDPNFAHNYLNLGTIYLRSGNVAKAIRALREAYQVAPENPRITISLAQLLATAPDASLRNGSEALRLIDSVGMKTGYDDPHILIVRAAAFAELGKRNAAIENARNAEKLALTAGRQDLLPQIQSFLKTLQKAGQD